MLAVGENVFPDVDGALSAWQMSIRKPKPGDLIGWLTELWIVTKHETLTNQDFLAKSKLYARQLQNFPADIVKAAIDDWPNQDGGQWFPDLSTLKKSIVAESAKRENLGKALKGFKDPENLKRRIRMMKFDYESAKDRGWSPKGEDVPDFVRGLQGSSLMKILPKYKTFIEDRIRSLKKLIPADP